MTFENETILLTGATGFVGRVVLSKLIYQSAANIVLLVRAKNGLEPEDRIRQIVQGDQILFPEAFDWLRIRVVESPDYLTDIGGVIHCASEVDWRKPMHEFYKPNVLDAVHLAKLFPENFVLCSSMGIKPLNSGVLKEELLPVEGVLDAFSKYGMTKAMAEEEVTKVCDCTIVRLGPIFGSESYPVQGWTFGSDAWNGVVYLAPRMKKLGLPVLFAANPNMDTCITPVDIVANNLIVALLERFQGVATGTKIYNVRAASSSETPTYSEAIKALYPEGDMIPGEEVRKVYGKLISEAPLSKKIEVTQMYHQVETLGLPEHFTYNLVDSTNATLEKILTSEEKEAFPLTSSKPLLQSLIANQQYIHAAKARKLRQQAKSVQISARL